MLNANFDKKTTYTKVATLTNSNKTVTVDHSKYNRFIFIAYWYDCTIANAIMFKPTDYVRIFCFVDGTGNYINLHFRLQNNIINLIYINTLLDLNGISIDVFAI